MIQSANPFNVLVADSDKASKSFLLKFGKKVLLASFIEEMKKLFETSITLVCTLIIGLFSLICDMSAPSKKNLVLDLGYQQWRKSPKVEVFNGS